MAASMAASTVQRAFLALRLERRFRPGFLLRRTHCPCAYTSQTSARPHQNDARVLHQSVEDHKSTPVLERSLVGWANLERDLFLTNATGERQRLVLPVTSAADAPPWSWRIWRRLTAVETGPGRSIAWCGARASVEYRTGVPVIVGDYRGDKGSPASA